VEATQKDDAAEKVQAMPIDPEERRGRESAVGIGMGERKEDSGAQTEAAMA
jgi:hypothetical protein